jgi:hypothetical protein
MNVHHVTGIEIRPAEDGGGRPVNDLGDTCPPYWFREITILTTTGYLRLALFADTENSLDITPIGGKS